MRVKSGGEIVVVTLTSLEGRTRDEVALQIGREWRIGQKGQPGDPARNTGIVVLVVPKETSPDGSGHLKIETGLGKLDTVIFTSKRAGGDRVTRTWVAPALGYLPVKAERIRKNKLEFTMLIESVDR